MRIPFAIPAQATRAFDIVGLGQNSVDYVASVASFPVINTKARLERFAVLPGGQVATAMVACARLGWRTRYVGVFGDDEAGRIARDSLSSEGVDLSAARTLRDAANRSAIILVDARSGDRTVLWHADPALEIGDIPADIAASGRLLLVDAEDLAASTACAAAARRAGVPTLIDVDAVQPGLDLLLREIDALVVAENIPAALTGHAEPGRALEALAREYQAAVVCVTLGAQGSLARCGGREIRTPAFHVECVDTTGSGDVFRAGFASACLRWPEGALEDILKYANAAAALSCRGHGARGALPTAQEIDRLLDL
jgi:sugar/nucleoside kinase (ribokinase family)